MIYSRLAVLTAGKSALFVYGGGSVRNGCYDDVKKALESAGGRYMNLGMRPELKKASGLVKENGIELVIGAGGANIMDCAKADCIWYLIIQMIFSGVKAENPLYGLKNCR